MSKEILTWDDIKVEDIGSIIICCPICIMVQERFKVESLNCKWCDMPLFTIKTI